MKRKDFLQKIVLSLGGVTILSCDNDFFEDIPLKGSMEDFSLEDAKNWYDLKYSNKNLRINSKEKVFKRKPNFDKATKKVSKNNETTLIVPIDYEDQYRPSLIHFDEKTRWKRNLVKEYLHPIVEFLIISKEKGKFTSHLYQIAYDLYKLPKNTKSLKLAELNGLILIADLDDKIKNATVYEKGKKRLIDNNQNNKKGKVSCEQWIEVEYYTYVGIDCGDGCGGVEITLHRGWQLSNTGCGGYGGNDGGYYDWIYNGGGDGSGSSGNGYEDPNYGVFVEPPYWNPVNGCQIANDSNGARNQLNENLQQALWGAGIAVNGFDSTIDFADVISRAVGAPTVWSSAAEIGLKKVGMVGLAIDGIQLAVGLSDGYQWDEDGWNAAQVGLGVLSIGLLATAPAWALGAGVVSVGIAIYTQSCE